MIIFSRAAAIPARTRGHMRWTTHWRSLSPTVCFLIVTHPTAQLSPAYSFAPPPLLPRLSTSLLNRVCDFFWERRLGIDTIGSGVESDSEIHHYGYLAYHTYSSIFEALNLQPTDVVVDVGCGKGRVVCTAARFRIQESLGVEIDPALCADAAENGRRMRGPHAPIRCACVSATDFDYDPVTVLVMFHPFGAVTMGQFLLRLEESLARRPRRLRIAYGNPLLSPMLAAKSWLKLDATWNPGTWSRIKFPVHFYSSAAPQGT